MINRGILYIIWGNRPWDRKLLELSKKSAEKYCPNIPIHVVEVNGSRGLLHKSDMLDLSPFHNTLYLDNDTIILDDLSFGFDMSEKHGIACCHDRACELERWHIYKNISEYNTGVIFFDKTHPSVDGVFNRWQIRCDFNRCSYPALVSGNDQPLFGVACYEKGFNPYVLPETWNYRRYRDTDSIFGNIKIWHTTKELTPEIESKILSNNEWKFYNA